MPTPAHVTAEDDDPVAGGAAFPRRPQGDLARSVYPDLDAFFEDLGKTYRKAVKAFYGAGCRYLQFDDTVWAYLCSQDELHKARERGDNPDGLQEIYARIINYAIADRPTDMVITTHVCRGNFRSPGSRPRVVTSRWRRPCWLGAITTAISWSMTPIAPAASNRCACPEGHKIVVLGLVTRKLRGGWRARMTSSGGIEEAAKFAPLEQLAVSPQCGFASTEEGNMLSEEEQWAKLRLAVEVANEVWGK